MILVAVGGAILGMVLTGLVSSMGIQGLAESAAAHIEEDLDALSREQLRTRIEDVVERVGAWMLHPQHDLEILAQITQTYFDHAEQFSPLTEMMAEMPYFEDTMAYYANGRYSQSAPDEPTVVMAQAALHNGETLTDKTRQQIQDTIFLDLVMPAIHKAGADKLNLYFIGDEESSFTRMAPWTDIGGQVTEQVPEFTDHINWFYYPGLIPAWEEWLDDAERLEQSLITTVPLYSDFMTGDIVQTFAHPIWDAERTEFIGAVWYDQDLAFIIDFVEQLRLAESGFAFIAQGDTNIFGVTEHGGEILGLKDTQYIEENQLYRYLSKSSVPAIAALEMPQDDETHISEVEIAGEQWLIALRQFGTMSLWRADGTILPESWTLGFAVPRSELYTTLITTQKEITQSSHGILVGQVGVLVLTSAALIGMTVLITRHMTNDLVALSRSAHRVSEGELGVRVEIRSEDEIGQLGRAFNDMTGQLQEMFRRIEEQNESLKQEITEREHAQKQREALIVELEAKTEEMEQFTYTVSHDLRSPLITIQGFLGYLEDEVAKGKTEKAGEDIQRIRRAAEKMQQLLDELLELSRIGRRMNMLEEVNFGTLAHEAADMVAGQITQEGVALEVMPDTPTVYGDPIRLRGILENLIDNAVKFMGEQPAPRIIIGFEEREGETVFFVRDNGLGIPTRYQDQIFDLFEKLDNRTEGTGIGLAIVKRTVEAHNGRIWVESEGAGSGSTFYFTLSSPD
jgi:signal transduction histidine kinase